MGRADPKKERRINLVLALGGLVLAIGGAIGVIAVLRDVAAGEDRVDCASYEFDPAEWDDRTNGGIKDDSQEKQAEALARCDTLVGMSRREITRMLGEHDTRGSRSTPRKWSFGAGWVNDEFGPGDGQTLYVHFNSAGEVGRATLAYPQR